MASSKSSSDIGVNKPLPGSSSSALPQYQPSLIQQSAQQQLQSMQQQRPSQNQGSLPSVPVVNNREDPNVWQSRKIVAGNPVTGNGEYKFKIN